jgi:hypothetical protein
MARFILDYDTTLNKDTKHIIMSYIRPSMVSPNADSAQYCLIDVINYFVENDFTDFDFEDSIEDLNEDIKDLKNLYYGESVNYIEICF